MGGPRVNTQQERDSQSFSGLAVFTQLRNVLSTQSRGLLYATEEGFLTQLTKAVRHSIRAILGDRSSAYPTYLDGELVSEFHLC